MTETGSTPQQRLIAFGLLAVLVLGLPRTLVQAGGAGLFLAHFPAQTIAWIYLATALCCPLVAALFLRLEARLPLVPLLIGVQIASAGVSLCLRLTYPFFPEVSAAGAFLWAQVENMTSSLVFWGLANQWFSISQAKREFARIGAGEQIGAVAIGLGIPFILIIVSTPDLLTLSAISNGAAALTILLIARSLPAARVEPVATPETPSRRPARFNRQVRFFIGAIFIATFFSNIAFFLLDNSFYLETQSFFDNEDAATGFVGLALAGAAGLSLLISPTIAPAIMARFGVAASLAFLPGTLLALTLLLLVISLAGVEGGVIIFALVVVLKLLDEAFRTCLYRPSFQALFQPLPAQARFRAVTLSEGFAEPAGIGTAAIILIALGALSQVETPLIALLLAPVLLAWLICTLALRRGYRKTLELAISGRQTLDPAAPVFAQPEARASVIERLTSAPVTEAARLVPLARQLDLLGYRKRLPELLQTGSPELASALLAHPQDLAAPDFVPQLGRLLDTLASPQRAALVDVLGRTGAADARCIVSAFEPANADERRARERALVVLGDEQRLAGLVEDARSAVPERRHEALLVLNGVDHPQAHAAIAALLGDPNPGLRHLAIAVAGRSQEPALFGALAERLANEDCTSADAGALIAAIARFGAPALGVLAPLTRQGSSQTRRLAIQHLARIPGSAAETELIRLALAPDPDSALAAATGLWDKPALLDRRATLPRLEALLVECLHLKRAGLALAPMDSSSLLTAALEQTIRRRSELMLTLAILSDGKLPPRRPLLASLLKLGDGAAKEYADEHFDLLLPIRLRTRAALLLGAPSQDLPERLDRALGTAARSPDQWRDWLTRTDIVLPDWVRACAVRIGALASGETENTMNSSIFEKVLLLKSVDLFSAIDDIYLAEVAPVIEEVHLDKDGVLMEAGTLGTTLYIVVAGALSVQRDGKELARLGPHDVVGELAALDPRPRIADVVATEPTHLLALTHEHLDMLIATHMDIAHAIIRTLTHRLRQSMARGSGQS